MYQFSGKLKLASYILILVGALGIGYGFLTAPSNLEEAKEIMSHHSSHGDDHASAHSENHGSAHEDTSHHSSNETEAHGEHNADYHLKHREAALETHLGLLKNISERSFSRGHFRYKIQMFDEKAYPKFPS